MRQMLVIADDLSGAADCGIACVGHGLDTIVVLGDIEGEIDADVLSIDADTRNLEPKAAASEIARILNRYTLDEDHLLFKKLDSTLRGNVAAELAAALEVRRNRASHRQRIVAVLAPAFPSNGRTTVNGRQLVHGKPLEETEIWQRERALAQSNIPAVLREANLQTTLFDLDLIRSGTQALQHAMARLSEKTDVLICDAETDQDLSTIAEASISLGRSTVWAGSAGLAYHLPQAAGFVRRTVTIPQPPLASGPTLFVIGSLSGVSRKQFELLASSSDVVVISIPPNILLSEAHSRDYSEHALALKNAMDAGIDTVVLPASEPRLQSIHGQHLSTALAQFVAPYADRIGALVATGGETARAVLQTWEVSRLRLLGELEPGLPLSVTEGWPRQLPVLTKAGGFGVPHTLLLCRQFLQQLDRSSAANLHQVKSKGL
jgi:D-threonate/D-erythronate kinase